jgi:septal ring factor EnvC (AmiA/AmiB activator)
MQPDLHQVNLHLNQVQGNTSGLDASLHELAAEIATLDKDLQQITADLKDIDQHVANLDRKTGPTPPLSLH